MVERPAARPALQQQRPAARAAPGTAPAFREFRIFRHADSVIGAPSAAGNLVEAPRCAFRTSSDINEVEFHFRHG